MDRPRVLIIDDDESLVYMLRENFVMEGYEVSFGFDGIAAITMAQSVHPQILILDINMPVANGIDALTYLRKDAATQRIPVIFITGLQSKSIYPVIDRNQRVAYIKKPIDLEHLNSLVRQFLADYPVSFEPAKDPTDAVVTKLF